MKHEVTTLHTKQALAASLKGFIEKKPLSKITVSEIIVDCGVNRKTFYYHFEDIYALLKWMLEDEAVNVVKQFDLLVDYREAVVFVMHYVRENKHLLCCAYDSMGRDEMKRFFYADFIGITRRVIQSAERRLGVHAEEQFKEFLATSIPRPWRDSSSMNSQTRTDMIRNKRQTISPLSWKTPCRAF